MIGNILRDARKRRQLTLADLAARIGVTAGYISNLEHNRLEPSLPVLRELADHLGIAASALFMEERGEAVTVVKEAERPTARFRNLAAPAEILTPFAWRGQDSPEIEALRMEVPPGAAICSADISFDYDEFIYVRRGGLEYRYGKETVHVTGGSGIFVPRRTGHHIQNGGDAPADIIWIAKSEQDGRGEAARTRSPQGKKPMAAGADLSPQDRVADSHGEADSAETTGTAALKFLGGRIRNLRKERGISISKFAEQIGMTPAYVSKIERNLLEPSLPVLRVVAGVLDIEMLYLFADVFPDNVLISEGGNMPAAFTIPGGRALFTALTPPVLKKDGKPDMSVFLTCLSGKKTDCDAFVAHDYVEFTLVLEGEIDYRTSDGLYHCAAGDSIHIGRNVPHMLYNPGDTDCRMLITLGNILRRDNSASTQSNISLSKQ